MKISILGVSRSGKTCYISAMSQVLKNCNLGNGCRISLKTNEIAKQLELDNNFMSMATEREWPKGTDTTTSYDFRIHFQSQDASLQLSSLTMDDYRGGMLNGMGKQDKNDRDSFIESMSDTAVITFLIDGTTVLNAMDELDKDAVHRGGTQAPEKLAAINEISIMENILYIRIQNKANIPPVLIVITKSDVFASKEELNNGISLVKDLLSALFSFGNRLFVGITTVSLGSGLDKGDNNSIIGQLDISTQNNIHIPMLFAFYAYLDAEYEKMPDKTNTDKVMSAIRKVFAGKISFYDNGKEAFSID